FPPRRHDDGARPEGTLDSYSRHHAREWHERVLPHKVRAHIVLGVLRRVDSPKLGTAESRDQEKERSCMTTRRTEIDPGLNRRCNGQAPDPYRPDAEHVRQNYDLHRAAEPASETGDDALPPLSEADQLSLHEYGKKIQLVRDRVVGVVRGRTTGLYVWGPGGTGKRHAIIGTLREQRANYRA